MTRFAVRASLFLLLLGVALPVVAGEGRIPIWNRTVIGTSGKYIVTREIPPGPGPAIDIVGPADHVDIDLNGFTVFGDPAGLVVIRAIGAFRSITIRNGEVRSQGPPGDAILIDTAERVVLEDLKIIDAGGAAIHLVSVRDFLVRDNLVTDPNLDGILVDGFAAANPVTGTISGNVFEELPGGSGIVVWNGSSVAVRNNRVEAAFGSGILLDQCQACLIAENTIQEVGSHGLEANNVSVSKFYNNAVVRAALEGFGLFVGCDDNLVLNNVIGGSGRNGILCDGSRNQIDQNVINGNGTSGNGHGIWFTPASGAVGPNTYGRNSVLGNPGAIGTCGASVCAAPEVCDDTGNASFGDNFGPGPC